jgi:hypothetical protein
MILSTMSAAKRRAFRLLTAVSDSRQQLSVP